MHPGIGRSSQHKAQQAICRVLLASTIGLSLLAVAFQIPDSRTSEFPLASSVAHPATAHLVVDRAEIRSDERPHPGAITASYWTNITGGFQPTSANASSPSTEVATSSGSMTYDGADGYSVLFEPILRDAGSNLGFIPVDNQTWALINGTWTNLTATAGAAPPGPTSGETQWTGMRMAYDTRDGYVIGWDSWGSSCSQLGSPCDGTWMFQAGKWTHLTTTGNPPSSTNVVLADDPADGCVVMYTVGAATGSNQTWTYSGGNWTQINPLGTANGTFTQPSLEGSTSWSSPGIAYDSNDRSVLLFGGSTTCDQNTNPSCYFHGAAYNQTWAYRAGNWTRLTPPTSPGGRVSPEMAADPTTGGVLLFGGLTNNPPTGYGTDYGILELNDSWIYSGGIWTNESRTMTPPGEDSAPIDADLSLGGVLLRDSAINNAQGLGCNCGNYTWEWGSNPGITGVDISGAPLPSAPGIPVSFSAKIIGGFGSFSYKWSFGDGATSNLSVPKHKYNSSGTFGVVLSVGDPGGASGIGRRAVVVTSALAENATSSRNPADAGESILFDARSTGGTGSNVYYWNLGDGHSSSANSVYHSYNVSGSYNVTVSTSDSAGEAATSRIAEVINPALGAKILATPNSTPNLGDLVNFSAIVTGGTLPYNYAWLFGDGGTGGNLSNISHIFTTNGPFTASVLVTDGAGANLSTLKSITIALNVSALGSSSFGATPLRVGFSSHVRGGSPGYTFNWNFGDGSTSNDPSLNHVYTIPGNYDAVLTVSDSGGHVGTSTWAVVVVAGGGNISVSLTSSSSSIELGQTISITANVSGGEGSYSPTWSIAPQGCIQSSQTSLFCRPSATGNYSVVLTVLDEARQTASGAVTFAVGGEVPGKGAIPIAPASSTSILLWVGSGALIGSLLVGLVAAGILSGRGHRTSVERRPAGDTRYDSFRRGPSAVESMDSRTEAPTIEDLF
jgi:PKD repeat protein